MAIHQSGHFVAINRRGLELLSINENTKDPIGGIIRREKGGSEPDGVFEEMAFFDIVFKLLGALGKNDNILVVMCEYANDSF